MKGFAKKTPEQQALIMAISDAACAITDLQALEWILRLVVAYGVVEREEARRPRKAARRAKAQVMTLKAVSQQQTATTQQVDQARRHTERGR